MQKKSGSARGPGPGQVSGLNVPHVGVLVYLVRRTVHPVKFLEVIFDQSLNLLVWLCVIEPLPLYQTLKERLRHTHTQSVI